MLVLGVDPGVKGGWAMLKAQEGGPVLLDHGAMPVAAGGRSVDAQALARRWRSMVWDWREVTAVMEAVGSRPGQGLVSTWAFARSYGVAEGLLAGLGVSNQLVTSPGQWKAAFGLTGGKGGKAASVALAMRLVADALPGRGGDALPGRGGKQGASLSEHEAEATLIAWHWALRGWGNGT